MQNSRHGECKNAKRSVPARRAPKEHANVFDEDMEIWKEKSWVDFIYIREIELAINSHIHISGFQILPLTHIYPLYLHDCNTRTVNTCEIN